MNQLTIIGNLTRDPELRSTKEGLPVCTFTVAVKRRYKNAKGEYESDFIQAVAWRKTAELLAEYFAKGDKIGITGSLQTRNYEDKAGVRRYITEVAVENISFIDSKAERQQRSEPDDWAENVPQDDTSLPFDM